MRNIEQELKLALTEWEYNTILRANNAEPKLQVNYYFAGKLLQSDEMVRVRKKEDKYILCYKKRVNGNSEIMVSDEREREIDAQTAQRYIEKGISNLELLELLSVHMAYDLRCVGSLNTYRAKFKLREWTIELDKNEYLGKTDYELECESDRVESLERLKSYLGYAYGVVLRPSKAKSERFRDKLLNKK